MRLPPAFPYVRTFVMTGRRAAGVARALFVDLHEALCAAGFPSELVMVEDGPGFLERAQRDGRPFFAIDGNQKIKLPAGVRKFSWMVDHPCSRLGDLVGADAGDVALGWVDDSHLAAAQAFGLPFRSGFFPHAGVEPVAAPMGLAERDIDVLFAGGLAEPLDRDGWRAANPTVQAVVGEVIFETAALLDRGEPVLPLFAGVAAGHGVDITQMQADVLCATISRILTISEMNRRCAILTALPDSVRIAVVSAHLPTQLRGRPNVTHLGFIDDFAEIRKLMGRSRIVLNCTNKFPDGAHERIWYGMAEGAAVVTDASRYLERDFVHGRDILYLPRHADLTEIVGEVAQLLGDLPRLKRLVDAARPVYAAQHTWAAHLETLFTLVAP